MAEQPQVNIVMAKGEVVKIEPGDKIIVHLPCHFGEHQCVQIRQAVEAWAGDGVKAIVVPPNFNLEFVRPDSAEAKQAESWRDREAML